MDSPGKKQTNNLNRDEEEKKTSTVISKLHSNYSLQYTLLPQYFLNNSSTVKFHLERNQLIEHVEPIYNGCFLMLVCRTKECDYHIKILGQQSLNNDGSIKPLWEFPLPFKSVIKTFILDGSETIIILSSNNRQFELNKFTLTRCGEIIQLQHTETMKLNVTTNFNFNFIAPVVVKEENFVALVMKEMYIHVYKCMPVLNCVKSMDISMLFDEKIVSLCFLDSCNKLAVTTSDPQFVLLEVISGQVLQKIDLNFLKFDCNDLLTVRLNKVYVESKCIDILFAITNKGMIYDITKQKKVNFCELTKRCSKQIDVRNSLTCVFNKCIYLFDGSNHMVYIYNAFQEIIMQKFKGSNNMCLSRKLSMNLLGDEFYFINPVRQNEICFRRVYKGGNFSLKYLARITALKYFSYEQLKDKNLEKFLYPGPFDKL